MAKKGSLGMPSADTRVAENKARIVSQEKSQAKYHFVPKFSPNGQKRMHALKDLTCGKRVAAALTSPARHACGCARPSRASFGCGNSKILSDGSKT